MFGILKPSKSAQDGREPRTVANLRDPLRLEEGTPQEPGTSPDSRSPVIGRFKDLTDNEDHNGGSDHDLSSRPIPTPTRRRATAARNQDGEPEKEAGPAKRRKLPTWAAGRRSGARLPVTIKLVSQAGRDMLREMGESDNNWPHAPKIAAPAQPNFTEISQDSLLHGRTRRQALDKERLPVLVGSSSSAPATDANLQRRGVTEAEPEGLEPAALSRQWCVECRRSNRICSLETELRASCRRCDELDLRCARARSETSYQPTDLSLTVPQTETPDGQAMAFQHQQAPDNTGRTTFIWTSFPLPLICFSQSIDDLSATCRWCEDTRYGLLGEERRLVEVRDSSDGKSFIEVGRASENEDGIRSWMCDRCSNERLQICCCTKHVLEPIVGLDETSLDNNTIWEWLAFDHSSIRHQWCSVCIQPAQYECSNRESNRHGFSNLRGCGLLLCKSCHARYRDRYDWDFDQMMTALDDGMDPPNHSRVRADTTFLRQDGPVAKRKGDLELMKAGNLLLGNLDDYLPAAFFSTPFPKAGNLE